MKNKLIKMRTKYNELDRKYLVVVLLWFSTGVFSFLIPLGLLLICDSYVDEVEYPFWLSVLDLILFLMFICLNIWVHRFFYAKHNNVSYERTKLYNQISCLENSIEVENKTKIINDLISLIRLNSPLEPERLEVLIIEKKMEYLKMNLADLSKLYNKYKKLK